jgi:hypothetical protein
MLQVKSTQEVVMNNEPKAKRLAGKSRLHHIQVELQQGYNLSPVEARVLEEICDRKSNAVVARIARTLDPLPHDGGSARPA